MLVNKISNEGVEYLVSTQDERKLTKWDSTEGKEVPYTGSSNYADRELDSFEDNGNRLEEISGVLYEVSGHKETAIIIRRLAYTLGTVEKEFKINDEIIRVTTDKEKAVLTNDSINIRSIILNDGIYTDTDLIPLIAETQNRLKIEIGYASQYEIAEFITEKWNLIIGD